MEDKENMNVKEVGNNANTAKERFEKRRIAMDAYKKIGLGNLIDRLNKFSEMLLPQLGKAMGIPSKNNVEIQKDSKLNNKDKTPDMEF